MRNFWRCGFVALLLLVSPGCTELLIKDPPKPEPVQPEPAPPSREQAFEAFSKLNDAFKAAYERTLEERGTRQQAASADESFEALDTALKRLGMIAENRDPEITRTLTVAAPAPRPLDGAEWGAALKQDLPMMAAIICPILGPYCRRETFKPDDYVIVINATVRPTRTGSEVQLTTRMREIRESTTGMPRREYPPPTAVRMALNKIWSTFDAELAARQRRGR